jgi:hypothetical protein
MEGNTCEKSPTALAPEQMRCWGGLSLSTLPFVAPLPKATMRTIGHEQNASRMARLDLPDWSVVADALLRQEPDEEEDEQNDEGDGQEDDDALFEQVSR